jgi:hypothetical protein
MFNIKKTMVQKLHQEFWGCILFTRLPAPELHNIFTWIFVAAPQHLFLLYRSILNIRFGAELHFFTAPAAVKGCGSSCNERMRLRLP